GGKRKRFGRYLLPYRNNITRVDRLLVLDCVIIDQDMASRYPPLQAAARMVGQQLRQYLVQALRPCVDRQSDLQGLRGRETFFGNIRVRHGDKSYNQRAMLTPRMLL